MATKANWPEKMKILETRIVKFSGHWESLVGSADMCKSLSLGETKEQAESRARQICALPKMVEFHKKIKAMSEKEFDHTWFPDEILEENDAILREIGEVE